MVVRTPPKTHLTQRAHDAIFSRVHGGNLVYNTCWEDPRLDREMLDLKADSRMVMITSAGCNALDYLLDGPAEIHAVDMNPRQNALLQLKIAMIRRGDQEDLFRLFGEGSHPGFKGLLNELDGQMHPFASEYWKAKHYYFQSSPLNPSFYYRGTAGQMAWIALQTFLRSPRVRDYVDAMLHVQNLDEQKRLYEHVKPALWNGLVSWLVRQPMAMTMLGVPRAQIRLIETQFPGGLTGFIQSKLAHVLTEVPFQDNYFWRAYLTGHYTRSCCPNYLKEEHQPMLQSLSSRITTHSTTVANFLRENPAAYSHYVLLDHQDWLAAHKPQALAEEWQLILENSRPGTRILMRSASPVIDFIPESALQRLRLNQPLADALHLQDRVGTYGCTLLADVIA
ncbi:S-adenosylmethionine-diacylglycerol 3-amino-3-carboxypropyl transferase [Prosthecobacter fusiformis]|uniref:S-adenosylmethionine-diacylglycerol 3-amino-3-carboxypropyl transferase n=1 Tax=Prosthecobacter fusiformis TaxID=48464 RepID=A0A4R7S4U3_9BACT|nr:BtaA family protein [Prosthecobacter fusiformis]TDU72879.1 S-adenosylmethionine-diacylglycerol 3-amino-3-carboxypropyl transferase [Prosthecobacter fusiformis]